jgi:hypothetical protein
MCIWCTSVAQADCTHLSQYGLNKTTLKAVWWFTMANKIDETTPVSTRTRSVLGLTMVCSSEDLTLIVVQWEYSLERVEFLVCHHAYLLYL